MIYPTIRANGEIGEIENDGSGEVILLCDDEVPSRKETLIKRTAAVCHRNKNGETVVAYVNVFISDVFDGSQSEKLIKKNEAWFFSYAKRIKE